MEASGTWPWGILAELGSWCSCMVSPFKLLRVFRTHFLVGGFNWIISPGRGQNKTSFHFPLKRAGWEKTQRSPINKKSLKPPPSFEKGCNKHINLKRVQWMSPVFNLDFSYWVEFLQVSFVVCSGLATEVTKNRGQHDDTGSQRMH